MIFKSSRKIRLGVILGAMLVALLAISTVSAQTSPTPGRATLAAQNNSGINGSVDLKDNGNGTTTVTVTVTGQPADQNAPAHIHVGNCVTLGAIKYPLTNVRAGTSTTIVNASIDTITGSGEVAVNLHKSMEEVAVYTSCGSIVRAVNAGGGGGTSPAVPAAGQGGSSQSQDNLLMITLLAGLAVVASASGVVLYTRRNKSR